MKNEVLQKALTTDPQVIPRYDVVLPDGTKLAENAQLVLKNTVLTEGTPLNKENLLSDDTAAAYGLDPVESTLDDAFKAIRDSVGYCPRIRVSFSVGGTVYVQRVDTDDVNSYTIPESGFVTAEANSFGQYKVWGVSGDTTTEPKYITVDTVKYYGVDIDYYTCIYTFKVESEIGATITVRGEDGTTLTGTIGSSKTCGIRLNKTGLYTVLATYDGCTSNPLILLVKSEHTGGSFTEMLTWATITVNVPTGSLVAVTSGEKTRGGTSADGTCKVWLPNTGTWTVTCTLNNKVATQVVNVDTFKNYTVDLKYYSTFGVRIPLSSSSPSSPEYTDDAIGFLSGYTSWAEQPIFKDIKPCLMRDGTVLYYLNKANLTLQENGTAASINSVSTGDVMVEFPKIGYRMYADDTYQYIKITNQPDHPDYCYLAHSLDNVGDCDKIYIAAYLALNSSSKLYSVSGATISNNIGITTARTYAQARGTGYQLLSFYPWTLVQCLYTIMYKNLNSVQTIGYGYSSQSDAAKTGGTNVGGPCVSTGTTGNQVSFLNIEDPWGNMMCHLDGICTDSNGKICVAYKDFNNTGSGYPYSKDMVSSYATKEGYVKALHGPSEWGFIASDFGGSSSTYYCDFSDVKAGCQGIIGRPYNNKGDDGVQGIYYLRVVYNNLTKDFVGARIVYKHKA